VSIPLNENIEASCLLKVGDNITTDHIMPAGANLLPYRSNIPYLSNYCFTRCDKEFPVRAKAAGTGIIVGGVNYGQGSSREHAALVPLYLGIKAVIAKSFARIHSANLVNAGIIPLTFKNTDDYEKLELGDELQLLNIRSEISAGSSVSLINKTKGVEIELVCDISERQRKMLIAGGLLNYTKENN
jgi:aconitate hydratase